ncbi:hypothetical protein, partial [Thiolapillus sp.]|uniref:hypothetical protein n=1 Tax=Thiolapillus sp. TaxID=2017437 RepID=UPI003AF9725B
AKSQQTSWWIDWRNCGKPSRQKAAPIPWSSMLTTVPVLGSPNRTHSLASYVSWGDVKATDLVELLYEIDK